MIKVSVVVPCYNQEKFLKETLDSVLAQTYSDWECIVVNDGSTDNSEQVILNYLAQDGRFKYLFQSNQGVSSARNMGIASACGEYILPLDGDDFLFKHCLEESVRVLSENSQVKVVCGAAELFGEWSGIWNLPYEGIKKLLSVNSLHCSSMFRRSEWETVGGYKTNMKYGWEDWDFWISILKSGGEVCKLQTNHLRYRIQKKSRERSIQCNPERYLQMTRQLYDNHAELYLEHIGNPLELCLSKEKLEAELKQITGSKTYMLAAKIGYVPKKIRGFFSRIKHSLKANTARTVQN
jgi:glycosyltransferase involved in cell wall biosynthesis